MDSINGKGQVLPGNIFIFPVGERLDVADLQGFISRNQLYSREYDINMKLYTGDHAVLHDNRRVLGPDNRLVANLPHYIVDTYNGFFSGIPVKISLDDDSNNLLLQAWNDANSFQDKLSEISKQADIYGRSLAFVYQDEQATTRIAYTSPLEAFMIYDDTVARHPLAFVRYWKNVNGGLVAKIYYSDVVQDYQDEHFVNEEVNPFGVVPAVEFYDNEERQGVFDNVKTLINALDKVLSQKANQVEYFDNAYLKILGINLDQDGDNKPDLDIINNQLIYSPDADATNATVDFITKPDGDNMQEHIIDRLISMIYQISMVANLNDEAFAGNSSGVALQYKLLPMKNMAANKERKFTQALRALYRVIFSVGTVLPQNDADAWERLKFKFTRNLPVNLADEAQTASTLSGIVSKETQLSTLSIVDDPQLEIERMRQEQNADVQNALQNSPSATDFVKDGEEDDDQEQSDDDSEE